MKITITPEGETHIETNGSSPADIAGLILSVQREMAKAAREAEEAERHEQESVPIPVQLNDVQGETYDYLVNNDNPEGIHLIAVARHFRVSKGAVSHRIALLEKAGFVRRVARGRYRAVTE